MRNKHILFLCQYFYPEKVSSGILPYELCNYLVKKGYEVKVLCGYPKEYAEGSVSKSETVNGIHVKRIKYVQLKRSNFIGRIINYFSFLLSVAFHFLYFRGVDDCIVYSNPPLLPVIPAFFKKIFHYKLLFVVYDIYPDAAIKFKAISSGGLIERVTNSANHYIYKKCNKIIVLSEEMKVYFLKHKNVREKLIEVIPNWYQSENMAYQSENNDIIHIMYGGNMGVMQDMKTLVQAIIQLKDNEKFHFIFAGHGVKKEWVVQELQKNNVKNFEIHDFLEKEKYDELMKKADCFVVSLEKNACGLGSPSKVYGYLASGKPLIAIMPEACDVVKDIKNYENGYFIEPNNVESLVNIFRKMDKKILKTQGKNSLRLYKDKYTLAINADKYIRILEKEGGSL